MSKNITKKFVILLIKINLLNLISLTISENPTKTETEPKTIDVNLKSKLDFYNKIKNLNKKDTLEIFAENDEIFMKTKTIIEIKDKTPTEIIDLPKDYVFHGCKI